MKDNLIFTGVKLYERHVKEIEKIVSRRNKMNKAKRLTKSDIIRELIDKGLSK